MPITEACADGQDWNRGDRLPRGRGQYRCPFSSRAVTTTGNHGKIRPLTGPFWPPFYVSLQTSREGFPICLYKIGLLSNQRRPAVLIVHSRHLRCAACAPQVSHCPAPSFAADGLSTGKHGQGRCENEFEGPQVPGRPACAAVSLRRLFRCRVVCYNKSSKGWRRITRLPPVWKKAVLA